METRLIWKDINGYEGHYQINNNSDVKSIKFKKQVILQQENNKGYLRVNLYINGRNKHKRIHILVARHFIPNPHNKPCINHKNGIKNDNRIKNLEWVTYKENAIHSYKNGLQKPPKSINSHFTKINHKIVKEIRQLYATKNYTQKQIAYKYKLHQSNIHRIIKYKTWKQEKAMEVDIIKDRYSEGELKLKK